MDSDSSDWASSSSNPFDSFSDSDNEEVDATKVTQYLINNQFGGIRGGKYKWKTLQHNGVLFPPPYIKHNVPIIYKGKEIILDKIAEEYATLYAKFYETEYVNNKIFNRNFWKDWRKVLGVNHEIQDLENCDFKLIYNYLVKQKEEKRKMTAEEKQLLKDEKDKLEEKYRFAIIDGVDVEIGNFRMEPPNIFVGRGCNKLLGSVKPRIEPEDIIINIGKEAIIPEPPIGHKWQEVVHDRNSEWLDSWIDVISGKRKYVWLAAHSKFKADSDIKKFDLARKLKRKINGIRKTIDEDLEDPDPVMRQLATAIYLIDNMAIRVGGEKGDDGTVGVTSLRVEHIFFHDKHVIELDFLGKDSIRYNKKHTVSDKVYKNLKEFTQGKDLKDDIFDKIDATAVNTYLQTFMKDLTAKVFRTYNASNLFQKELNKIDKKIIDGHLSEDNLNEILDLYNKANVKVAILCNHKKAVTKSFSQQIDKIDDRIKLLRRKLATLKKKSGKKNIERINKLKDQIDELKAKKKIKIELKDVATDTSKANYIDPRISISFMKRHKIPIDKLFSKALQDKFSWAMDVEPDWKF